MCLGVSETSRIIFMRTSGKTHLCIDPLFISTTTCCVDLNAAVVVSVDSLTIKSQLSKRKREGLDLCLWIDPERLLRAAICKDPTVSYPRTKGASLDTRRAAVVL